MTGQSIVWSHDGDFLAVAAPGAAALWRERSGFEGRVPPRFHWRVRLAGTVE
jgi:hypothetical protein